MTKLLLTLSLGHRPWTNYSLPRMQSYASRYGYDFLCINNPFFSAKDLHADRYQTYGRVQKLGIYRFLDIWDRILFLDDSVLISPLSPDIADIVPEGVFGVWHEGKENPARYQRYLKFHQALYNLAEPIPTRFFINSGVMLFDKNHRCLFPDGLDSIYTASKDIHFSDQGYLSKRVFETQTEMMDIGQSFNYVGSKILNERKALRTVFFYHLTSALKAPQRLEVAQQLEEIFCDWQKNERLSPLG